MWLKKNNWINDANNNGAIHANAIMNWCILMEMQDALQGYRMHCTVQDMVSQFEPKWCFTVSPSCFTVLHFRFDLAKAVFTADGRCVHQIFQFAWWTHGSMRLVSWWGFLFFRTCTCTHITTELFTTSIALFKIKTIFSMKTLLEPFVFIAFHWRLWLFKSIVLHCATKRR